MISKHPNDIFIATLEATSLEKVSLAMTFGESITIEKFDVAITF